MVYKTFVTNRLFIVEGTQSIDAGKLTFVKSGINFIGRTDECNGIQGKIKKREYEPNAAYTLTATVIGNYKYVKFQEEPYYCSQNINKLTPRFSINIEIGLYFRCLFQKFVNQYNGQQGGYKLDELKAYSFLLPIKTDKYNIPIIDENKTYHDEGYIPDFDYMYDYIIRQEKIQMANLEKYLVETGLSDCVANESDNDICNISPVMKEFRVVNIFVVNNTHNILKSEVRIGSGSIPYVTASSENNGVVGYIDYDRSLIETGNCIFIGGNQ